MRFECYRNKVIVVEDFRAPVVDVEPVVSEPMVEAETTSDTSEEVSTPMFSETNEGEANLPKEDATPSIEEPKQPSEYETLRANAIAEKERASQEKLDKVLTYTKRTLVPYLDEASLRRLCGYITEYYLSDSLPKVELIKLDSQLKSIDAMHFGWNIGKAFSKPRLQTATFIKRVFAHTLRDVEISTIERKMSHTESECKIRLNGNILNQKREC
jgi:mobilizable transposon, tnpC protein